MKYFCLSLILAVIAVGVACPIYSEDGPVDSARHIQLLSSVLIKSTLTAVNHGNITGNYAVLRELGSPVFKENYTAADLATSFAALRRQKVDLSPVLLVTPQLIKPPFQDQEGRLHLEGYCHLLNQQRVEFHLVYQTVSSGWLIEHIAIGVNPVVRQASDVR